MDTEAALARLRAERGRFKGLGVEKLSMFGSRARGDSTRQSDFDFAVKFSPGRRVGMFDYVTIKLELEKIVGTKVDLVPEPARKARLQNQIDLWRQDVF